MKIKNETKSPYLAKHVEYRVEFLPYLSGRIKIQKL